MWHFKKDKQPIDNQYIKALKKERLDLDSLFTNINNRSKMSILYKELSKLWHPDLYENDPQKKELAQMLFVRVQNSKSNYNSLLQLKEEIECYLIKDI